MTRSLVIACVALAACVPDETPQRTEFDFALSGVAYDVHDGETLYYAVWDDAIDDGPVASGSQIVAGGTFIVSSDGALERGARYTVAWYADVDGDAVCDAPPDDHVWSTSIGPVRDDVTLTHVHDTAFDPSACALL